MKNLTVIRTAVGSMVAAGLIEKLRAAGVRVIGVDASPTAVCASLCDAFYTVPLGKDPAFVPAMLALCKKENIDAIISGPEEELAPLSAHAAEFQAMGVKLCIGRAPDLAVVMDKKKFAKALGALGLASPREYKSVEELTVPYIVKPRRGRGSQGIQVVHAPLPVAALEPDMVYQQYLSGNEYSIDCFFNDQHEPLLLVPRVRLKTESGVSIVSKTIHHSALEAEVARMGRELQFTGPFCIQCIEQNDIRYFTDCNPRFGGGSILSCEASPSFIPMLIAFLQGEPTTPDLSFKDGLLMQRYYCEIFHAEK
jgi:carbamoyl-phosphate synthase large subunit